MQTSLKLAFSFFCSMNSKPKLSKRRKSTWLSLWTVWKSCCVKRREGWADLWPPMSMPMIAPWNGVEYRDWSAHLALIVRHCNCWCTRLTQSINDPICGLFPISCPHWFSSLINSSHSKGTLIAVHGIYSKHWYEMRCFQKNSNQLWITYWVFDLSSLICRKHNGLGTRHDSWWCNTQSTGQFKDVRWIPPKDRLGTPNWASLSALICSVCPYKQYFIPRRGNQLPMAIWVARPSLIADPASLASQSCVQSALSS